LLYTRAQKYRTRLTQQLPGFLDNTVRLVTIGNSVQAAFQMAAASTKDPLQSVMEKAASLARAGMDLENAVAHVARQTRLDELHLLAAILRISVRYGGRVDLLLERVANFMRDREQAEQDLSAMTAETRLSAWVLSLLPVAVCCLIISFNASYFLNMWNDASGATSSGRRLLCRSLVCCCSTAWPSSMRGQIDGDIPSFADAERGISGLGGADRCGFDCLCTSATRTQQSGGAGCTEPQRRGCGE
jgi:Flp pilus assembly protein TadB